MHLTHLSLRDFRSYAQAELPLDPGITVLVGPNGVGKTNIVEAIGYLATQDSHRVGNDAPLVRFGAERALIGAGLRRGSQDASVEIELVPGKANRARINRSAQVRAREALGLVRSVLFAPEDLELVKGDPGARRRFVDDLVVQLRPDQAAARGDYERVLKQRNALLKSARTQGRLTSSHEATLDVWDTHLAEAGARVLRNRLHVLGLLAPHIDASYRAFTDGGKPATVRYDTAAVDAQAEPLGDASAAIAPDALLGRTVEELAAVLSVAMLAARRREVERGVTLVGPHRDDIVLGLGPAPAKGFASHGETWSLALALRLAAYAVLVEDDPSEAARPVLILDDVFAELDTRRRMLLVEAMGPAQQILVTAAVRQDVPQELQARFVDVGPGWIGAPAESEKPDAEPSIPIGTYDEVGMQGSQEEAP